MHNYRLIVCMFMFLSSGCVFNNKGTTVLIATVKSVDDGVDVFVKWGLSEEDRIANDAIKSCKDKKVRADFDVCVRSVVDARRATIDKVKDSIRTYKDLLAIAHGVQTQNVLQAANAVIDALSIVGIKVIGSVQ